MAREPASETERAARIEARLLDADDRERTLLVGAPAFARLVDVSVTDDRALIRIPIPAPSGDTRARVETEIRDAARRVDGVATVDVTWATAVPDPGRRVDALPDVNHVIAVGSGKGGVGKSTVATNLAVTLAGSGAAVGLLDADVHGPNAPKLLGVSDRTPDATLEDTIRPRTAHGVRVMSMGFLLGEDDPVIWRGVLVDEFLKQLLEEVAWGDLDYLVVDLPPGTGDAHLTATQYLPLSGAVIVTTPQPVAVGDSERTIQGFARYDVPILGIIENMSRFECPDCGTAHHIFGSGGARTLSKAWDVPVLGRLPIDPEVGPEPGADEDDATSGWGLDVPLVGRLRLPRTREARVRQARPDPVAVRRGDLRERFELIATRTALRLAALTATS